MTFSRNLAFIANFIRSLILVLICVASLGIWYEIHHQTHIAELSIGQIFKDTGMKPVPQATPRADLPPNWPANHNWDQDPHKHA